MPDRSGARRRKSEETARRATLADSFGRIPAARSSAASGPLPRLDRYEYPDDTWAEAERYQEYQDESGAQDESGWGEEWRDADESRYQIIKDPLPTARMRAQSLARPLPPALPEYNHREASDPRLELFPALPTDSAPDLMAFRAPNPPKPRVRHATERLVQRARNPWNIARLILALAAITIGLLRAPTLMGEASNPLQAPQAQVNSLMGAPITSLIQPETQLKRPDLYDNMAQFYEWGDAACSAAALSEILTAYGVKGATIGHEIDELGSYISPNGGLLNRHGFAVVAAKHGLRADESNSWTFNQMVYVSQQLGLPVIVNVHISYGYYSFFSGGHFLVVVGGDSQGLAIVDSSEYYIHYLPKDVFYQMFTGYTAAIVPADDHYTLPAN